MSGYYNKYDGLRKVTISRPAGANTRVFTTLLGNKVGNDGLDIDVSPIEQTIESFASTYSVPVGVEIKPATLHLIPYDVDDKGGILADGYVPKKSWSMVLAQCNLLDDVTIAFEKVCANPDGTFGVNWLFRHAQISNASQVSVKRANTTQWDLTFYPIPAPGTDYGLTGADGNLTVAWQEYMGQYDPNTDKVKYEGKTGDNNPE